MSDYRSHYSGIVEKAAAHISNLADVLKIKPDDLALEFAVLEDGKDYEWHEDNKPLLYRDQFWFDVAEHINPDLLDGAFGEGDPKYATELCTENPS